MRKNSRIFEPNGEQINLYDIFDALQKYWQRFLLVSVIALIASYAYFLKTLPAPHSQIVVKVGFDSIKGGKYPDGSVFNQNDFVNDAVVKAALENVSELKNAKRWTVESLKNALLVSPVYPLEIRMAKNQLANENPKATLAEMQANYDKVMYFYSSEYILSFSPVPAMPQKLQERFLSEIVRQYSDFVLRQHLPLGMAYEDYIGDYLLAQKNYYPAYEYFAKIVKTMEELAYKTTAQTAYEPVIPDSLSKDGNSKDIARLSVRQDNKANSHSLSINALESKLMGIRAQLDKVGYGIFDEKSLAELSFIRRMLEMEISDKRVALETKKKQAEYKVYLASLPINGLAKDRSGEPQDRLKNIVGDGGAKSNTIVDMLLTYTNQYYQIINEADAINNEIADLQVELSRKQEELKRIDIPYSGKEPIENRARNLVASLEKTNDVIKETLVWQTKEIRDSYEKNQPPVANNFIVQGENVMPLGKVFGVAIGATAAFMVFQIAAYSFRMAAERQKKLADVTAVQSPQISRKI